LINSENSKNLPSPKITRVNSPDVRESDIPKRIPPVPNVDVVECQKQQDTDKESLSPKKKYKGGTIIKNTRKMVGRYSRSLSRSTSRSGISSIKKKSSGVDPLETPLETPKQEDNGVPVDIDNVKKEAFLKPNPLALSAGNATIVNVFEEKVSNQSRANGDSLGSIATNETDGGLSNNPSLIPTPVVSEDDMIISSKGNSKSARRFSSRSTFSKMNASSIENQYSRGARSDPVRNRFSHCMSKPTPSYPSNGSPKEESNKAFQKGDVPMGVIRECIINYCTVETAQAATCVSKEWYHHSKSEKWLHQVVKHGHVARGEELIKLWRYCMQADTLRDYWIKHYNVSSGAEAYDCLIAEPVGQDKLNEIGRDVPRTFPTLPQFQEEENRNKLASVLRALNAAQPDVGYCQGMNFVIAVFLLHTDFDEGQSTWLSLGLMKNCCFDQLYSPGVPLLPLRTFQFSELVKKHYLPMYLQLQANAFHVDIFSHQWMLTLFAYIIDPDVLAHIWSVIFLIGWKAIFQIGLGIAGILGEDILYADSLEDISVIVHSQKKRIRQMVETYGVRDVLDLLLYRTAFVEESELEILGKNFMLQRWDSFLSIPDSVPSGFELIPGDSENGMDLLINSEAFFTQDLPPWKIKGQIKPIKKSITVPYEEHSRLREEILQWDETVRSDVECFTRRIAQSHKELEDFNKKHLGLKKNLTALEDKTSSYRLTKKNLINSMFASSMAGSGHRNHMRDLHSKIVDTERSYADISGKLKNKEKEWTPVREELDELQMKKQMVMDQLANFLSITAEKRTALLSKGVSNILH